MGHLKNIANQPKLQTFPNAQFEIAGDVPAAQCSEAQIEGDDATTTTLPAFTLWHPGAFAGWALNGKTCRITASVGGNTGDFLVVATNPDFLGLGADPGNGDPVTYHVIDGGELILTRNVQSFAEFIHAAGYAYTIKGGKLYTTMPSSELQNACTILFDPLT